MVWNTFSNSVERNKYVVREDWTNTRNPTGQTPNPEVLSQAHEASVSKGLDDAFTATSHTSIGLVTSTPYVQHHINHLSGKTQIPMTATNEWGRFIKKQEGPSL